MYHNSRSATAASAVFLLFMLLFSSPVLAQLFGRDGLPLPNSPAATDGSSNCYLAYGGLGCDNAECEATVCGVDSFCCEAAWDSLCAEAAVDLCPVAGGDVPRAEFEVIKVWDDGNPGEVVVTLNCFTGLPLQQSQSISEGQNVTFIVTDYDDGELDCEVSESVPDGYSSYHDALGGQDGDDECTFENVVWGAFKRCTITNTPEPVPVVVHKEWVYTNTESGNEVDDSFKIKLRCDAEIQYGYQQGYGNWSKSAYGEGDETFTFWVNVEYGGATCSVEETVFDGGVELDDSDCDNLQIDIGQGAECTIVNTVFYEGIPTLGQYGIAILALLMLTVGFVGFRRFA